MVCRRLFLKVALISAVTVAGGFARQAVAEEPNTLTPAEQTAGWRLLFDGKTTTGWRGFKSDKMPGSWHVENGSLLSHREKGKSSGDIVTIEQFSDFELTWEWKMTRGGNTGLIYRAHEDRDSVWESGPEYQMLDNQVHVDGMNPLSSAGACYSAFAPAKDMTRPVGEWNQSRLLARGKHIEHWMNGEKLLEYDVTSRRWYAFVKTSKFFQAAYGKSAWGQHPEGHIALQDYGGAIELRSLKIRPVSEQTP